MSKKARRRRKEAEAARIAKAERNSIMNLETAVLKAREAAELVDIMPEDEAQIVEDEARYKLDRMAEEPSLRKGQFVILEAVALAIVKTRSAKREGRQIIRLPEQIE